jgi:hypothetical protein
MLNFIWIIFLIGALFNLIKMLQNLYIGVTILEPKNILDIYFKQSKTHLVGMIWDFAFMIITLIL